MTSPHPNFETLLDLAEGRRVPSIVRQHVSACEPCGSLAADVDALLATMTAARGLEEVPDEVRNRAMEAVRRELADRRAPVSHILERFIQRLGDDVRFLTALLAGDSLRMSPVTRGGSDEPATPRMLLYEADGYEVTVSVAAGERHGTVDVSGQITPSAGGLAEGGTAGLRVAKHTTTTALSEFGEFRFESVPSGELELEIGVGTSIIRLARIPRTASE